MTKLSEVTVATVVTEVTVVTIVTVVSKTPFQTKKKIMFFFVFLEQTFLLSFVNKIIKNLFFFTK